MTGPGWPGDWVPVVATALEGDPVEVAPRLLGRVVARRSATDAIRAGRIVEVEAYRGTRDPASHAFRGPTPRTEVMFGPAGHLYVYRSYGMHWCANVVCDRDGTAGAVLLRALEPMIGIEAMWEARPKARRLRDLMSGPGKLCAALGVTGDDNGADLTGAGQVVVCDDGTPPPTGGDVGRGPRVGISKAVDEPWRWWDRRSIHVSR